MSEVDVAVIGAGPYGLSVAAHLRASGLEVKIFGKPMSFWDSHMPAGMFLRSPWVASFLSDPKRDHTLDAYREASGNHFSAPVPLSRFVEYGKWFQRELVPEVDPRWVQRVSFGSHGFRLSLEGGEEIDSQRVVVAAGIEPFASRPPQFKELPIALASHSVDHKDLGKFRGRRVLVVGGGQSALESGALLHENGAEAEIVLRAPAARFLGERQWMHEVGIISRLLYAPPDVGPALLSHLVARPRYFRLLPPRLRQRFDVRSVRPAGARWLRPRLQDVPITAGRSVALAERANDLVKITLDDGSVREVDHVLLATGYRIDISKYNFLSHEILSQVSQVNNYPRLNAGFETSVVGIHFVGAPAAWSFGPLLRFVAGTEFTTRALKRGILKSLGHRQ
jgi:cation diffusion facilitator CzcD-associated flavoprotein CzcO